MDIKQNLVDFYEKNMLGKLESSKNNLVNLYNNRLKDDYAFL